MLHQYLNILEVSRDSGILEIKRAFRKKAKKFHPDLNKDSGAQENFILVNEAYEFLMKHYNQPGFKSKKPQKKDIVTGLKKKKKKQGNMLHTRRRNSLKNTKIQNYTKLQICFIQFMIILHWLLVYL